MEFYAPLMRLPDGWVSDVRLSVNNDGIIVAIENNTTLTSSSRHDVVHLSGPVVAGIPNSHSHAFQRLMAGRAEWRAEKTDSFWSWRDVMYRCAAKISPDELHEVATHLYIEMLRAGYTHVCEFHYLHHSPDGSLYSPHGAMADALIEAARSVGITLTLLPTLYMAGGFDGRELTTTQKRFYHQLDDFTQYLEGFASKTSSKLNLGAACHSLRAVPVDALKRLVDFLQHWNASAPFHIHVSEQQQEVEEAVKFLGQRPVEWLLSQLDLPRYSCLIHATHINSDEIKALASSSAVVSICTTTEANLGDGLFPLSKFLDNNGKICVGSDSQISVSPIEELRWLEYGQRLISHQRNTVATAKAPNTGDVLWQHAVNGGAVARGRDHAGLSVGAAADFLVLNVEATACVADKPAQIIDALVFNGSQQWIDHVYVRGKHVIEDGQHVLQHQSQQRFNKIASGLDLG